MNIGILGFMHESNSFINKKTTINDFKIYREKDIITHWSKTHHEIGGFIQTIKEKNHSITPLITASATPSGVLTRYTYEKILEEISKTLSTNSIDGLLLALHGAMIAEGYDDADGNTVKVLREQLGSETPIILTLDCHANVSQQMVDNVDAAILYRTNPHIDQRERGKEAAELIYWTIKEEVKPLQYLEQVPTVINISKQNTSREPLLRLINKIKEIRTKNNVLSVSLGLGFAFGDVEKMGTSIIVVTDDAKGVARDYARQIGRLAWGMKDEFLCELPPPAEAVNIAGSLKGPVVLMDVGDNVGGGSPGDSTILIREIIEQGINKALVVLTDPEAVKSLQRKSVGDDVRVKVGAKQDSLHGTPIEAHGEIMLIHDGRFTDNESRHGGQLEYYQGTTVVLKSPENHLIVLNSIRTPPFSLNQLISLGINPQEMKIIIVKGVVAPLAAYEPIAEKVIAVDTLGSTSANIHSFNYRHRRIPLYPLEKDTKYVS